MARLMDFTTEQPNCCVIGDILEVEEYKLPTSYWYVNNPPLIEVGLQAFID